METVGKYTYYLSENYFSLQYAQVAKTQFSKKQKKKKFKNQLNSVLEYTDMNFRLALFYWNIFKRLVLFDSELLNN